MAIEQKAMELIERLLRADEALAHNEQPGLYDEMERLFQCCRYDDDECDRAAWSVYKRTGTAWYDKRLHPMQIARLIHVISADPMRRSICATLERIIRAHEDGGVIHRSMDERTFQAKRLWTAQWGLCLGANSFAYYLASVPPIPDFTKDVEEHFPRLMLVDTRLSLAVVAKIAHVFLPPWFRETSDASRSGVHWLRCRSRVLYRRDQTPKEYVDSLKEPERMLTLREGLFTCVHDFRKRRTLPITFSGLYTDVPGPGSSVYPNYWPLITRERVEPILSTEHQELQVLTCLPPEL